MNTNDLSLGFDPTNQVTLTGAQLAQLITTATPSSDRGMMLFTTDSSGVPVIPNAAATTEWQRFLWLRLSPLTSSFVVCVWNPNQTYNMGYSDGSGTTVSTNWNPIVTGAIPAGSIQGFQVAASTITKDKILNIDLAQVNGSAALLSTSTQFAGAVTGTSAAMVIPVGSITSALLATDASGITSAVGTTNIINKAVTPAKIAGGTNGQVLLTTDGTTDAGWVTKSVLQASEPSGSGQVPVSTGAGAYGALVTANSSGFGRILQQFVCYDAQILSDTSHIAVTSMPQYSAAGTLYGTAGTAATPGLVSGTAGLIAAITPISATSKIRVELCLKLGAANNDYISTCLFVDTSGNKFSGFTSSTLPKAATCQYDYGNGICESTLVYEMTSGQTTEIDFVPRFGAISYTAYTNRDSSKTSFFGGVMYSWIKVTEYI